MTTMEIEGFTCCVCKSESSHSVIHSTSTFGSCDLDTRPAELMRSTIYQSIQRCPSCGYCSSDISTPNTSLKDVTKLDEYRAILTDSSMPATAASFLAESLEFQLDKKFAPAAWSAMSAAWVCDDEGDLKLAEQCRKKAILLINEGNKCSQNIADQEGASEAITVDLMRRCGLLEEALALVSETKERKFDKIINVILAFEEELIGSGDRAAHTVAEALGDE